MSMPGAQQGGLHPFQSAPGVEAGGNRGEGADRRDRGRFNPPPALRPGGSRRPTPKASRRGTFQSAPGVEAGGNGLALTHRGVFGCEPESANGASAEPEVGPRTALAGDKSLAGYSF